MNLKNLIVVLVIMFFTSGCGVSNSSNNNEEESNNFNEKIESFRDKEVRVKVELISKDPLIMIDKFYVNDKEIAWQKYSIDMTGSVPKSTLLDFNGKIPDGIVKGKNLTSEILTVFNYKNNKKHGKFEYYDMNGKLFQEGTYEDGELLDYKSYDGNGNVIAKIYYQDGEPIME